MIARFMAAFCLLMVPAHAAIFGGAGHPLIALGFAVVDIAAAISWRLAAREQSTRTNITPTERTPS